MRTGREAGRQVSRAAKNVVFPVLARRLAAVGTAGAVVSAVSAFAGTIVDADSKHLVQITVDTTGTKVGKTAELALSSRKKQTIVVAQRKQWVNAGELQSGMWLRMSAGVHVQIQAI